MLDKLTDMKNSASVTKFKIKNANDSEVITILTRTQHMVIKYSELVTMLRLHGVEFILATGDNDEKKKKEVRHSHRPSKKGNPALRSSGLFSSLDRGTAQQSLLNHQSNTF